jgi:diaminohydroxyphosphoribosylaminopyrimidine deaminase/5-amino-6-(5-phosphoribosylamino)uracil reductase
VATVDDRTERDDERWMGEARRAAGAARRLVSPRPWVGAVVVAPDGGPVGIGATDGRRGPHAEVVALRAANGAADGAARGATLYVTLEPCSHHGATPPCADAVIDAGVARVVVGTEDPDPRVAGEGIARLRAAGIEVDVGVGRDEVEAQLAPYLTHRRTGRPYVVCKVAASIDGRTAAPDGSSQWITGEAARLDAHRLRADSDAIVVGAGTVRADDPSLTVRLPAGEADGIEPRRIVLGHVPPDAKIHPCLEWNGDVAGLLDELGGDGVLQLMVEGGASVAHQFHVAGLVDRYVVYQAPVLFGGDDARPMFAGAGAPTMAATWRGRVESIVRLGRDWRIDLVPAPAGEEGT